MKTLFSVNFGLKIQHTTQLTVIDIKISGLSYQLFQKNSPFSQIHLQNKHEFAFVVAIRNKKQEINEGYKKKFSNSIIFKQNNFNNF